MCETKEDRDKIERSPSVQSDSEQNEKDERVTSFISRWYKAVKFIKRNYELITEILLMGAVGAFMLSMFMFAGILSLI